MDKRNRLDTYIADLQKRIAALEKRMPYKAQELFNQAANDRRAGLAQRLTVQGDVYYIGADGSAVLNLGQFTRLGIGAAADATNPLIIAKAASNWAVQLDSYSDTNTEYGEIDFRRSGSDTLGVLAATDDVFYFGRFAFQGVNAAGTPARKTAAAIYGVQVGAAGATYVGGKIRFDTGTSLAAPAERMSIMDTGQVIVGAPTDAADANPLLRIWKATAGVVDSPANTILALENSDNCLATILAPNTKYGELAFGFPANNEYGMVRCDYTAGTIRMAANSKGITCQATSLKVDKHGAPDTINSIIGTVNTNILALSALAQSLIIVGCYFGGGASGTKSYLYLVDRAGTLRELHAYSNSAGEHTFTFDISGGYLRNVWTCPEVGNSVIITATCIECPW